MLRTRFLAILAGFLLVLTAPLAASAAAAEPLTPAEISTLLGGTPETRWITGGTSSADGTRIVFSVIDASRVAWAGPEPWTDAEVRARYTETWAARADGTQAVRVYGAGDYVGWYMAPEWVEPDMVRLHAHDAAGNSRLLHFGVTVGSDGKDAWRELKLGEWGDLTPDGRFRVVFYGDLVADDDSGGTDYAYEVATGKRYVIGTHAQSSRRLSWENECGDAIRNPQQTLLGAVSGPKPACLFARAASDVEPDRPKPDSETTTSKPDSETTTPKPDSETTTPKPDSAQPTQQTAEQPSTPATTQPQATLQVQSQPVTAAPLLKQAKVLAVGKKLGGKRRNLLTVKFAAPAGYGLRVTLALRDGGKILASTDLTDAQAQRGAARLKLSAKSRKLLSTSKGRVTVRVVPLSDG